MVNADLARIINSDEIQSVLNPAKRGQTKFLRKKNPLRSIKALEKMDAYAAASRRAETLAQETRNGRKKDVIDAKRATSKTFKKQKKAFYAQVSAQGDVCEDGFGL
uniref:Large ribosomal subunit protein uL4 C-terminal domain-containing protein n=1 Tax=Eucampia antarctica TaxID=49252 RepID=A0A7S2SL28_9STRA|mmetsp:Transcript_8920/g.8519  ORF Transcript_8920/g.8519 Transcript_8920/m.8519 type:complete len:106 (+) Transcript_8920:1-318(+)